MDPQVLALASEGFVVDDVTVDCKGGAKVGANVELLSGAGVGIRFCGTGSSSMTDGAMAGVGPI